MEQQRENTGVVLEKISNATLTIFERDLELQKQFYEKYKYLLDIKQEAMGVLGEVKLPVVGDVSAGKSSLINTLCKFPISPVAQTTTSSCPLEIRYASQNDERLEVAPIIEYNINKVSKPIYTYGKDMQIDANLFIGLYEYAIDLGQKQIIQVGDTLAYFKAPEPTFLGTNWDQQSEAINGTILNPKNRRHVMHLLLILLGAYVFQDKPRENLSPIQKQVLEARDKLMEKLQIPNDITYVIRLYWNSELIPQGTVIIDLPGLGAAAEEGNGQMKHDDQVQKYMDDVPSLMFLLSPKGKFGSDEAKLQLDTFIATNAAKKSPARTLFVLNKADMICEADEDEDSNEARIRTVVNQYITNSPEYEEYPFYAISARAGERYFSGSGIPLDNMFATRLEKWSKPSLKKLSVKEKRENAEYLLDESFEREYACIVKDRTEQMNLQTFVCHFFSEEVGKIRLLHIIDEIEEHFGCIDKWASDIKFELKQLEVADSFGKEIFDLLSKESLNSLNQIFNEVLTVFSEVSDEFYKNLFLERVEIAGTTINDPSDIQSHPDWKNAYQQVCDRVQKQGSVIRIFEQCDNKLSQDINKKIENISFSQHKTITGSWVIPLDKNAVFEGLAESSTMAKLNYNRLVACGDDIAKMNFVEYFNPAFKRLKTVFDQDHKAYGMLVDTVANTIRHVPSQMQIDMERNFENIWEDAKALGVAEGFKCDFRKLYIEIVKSMADVLNSLFDEIILQLKKDARLEAEINKTLDNIRVALKDVLSPYTKSFGDTVYNQVIKGSFVVRMNQQQFKDFVKKNYIDKFNDQMKGRLRDILYGGLQSGTQNGHTQRISTAVKTIQNDYLSSVKQKQLKDNLMASVNKIKELLQTPAAVNQRRQELLVAASRLQQFFVEDFDNPTVYGWLKNYLIGHLEETDWANTTLSIVSQKAELTKEKIEILNII